MNQEANASTDVPAVRLKNIRRRFGKGAGEIEVLRGIDLDIHRGDFAAIAPICGGGNPKNASKYGKLPIWVFHGDADTRVEIESSQKMVDAVKAARGNVKFTIYPGVGHNSWSKTYANPELYQWFIAHQKKKK